jgi:hypothetical protein
MVNGISSSATFSAAAATSGRPERKAWERPAVLMLKAGAAENGPNFPTADGIEGQS